MHRALSRGEDGVALDLERHEGLWSQSLESWGELGWQGLQTLSLRDREGRPGLPQIRRPFSLLGILDGEQTCLAWLVLPASPDALTVPSAWTAPPVLPEAAREPHACPGF